MARTLEACRHRREVGKRREDAGSGLRGDGSTPCISVCIVLYNCARELRACLESIQAEVDSGWAEVVAVDNASPDDSVAMIREIAPSARLVRLATNRGFAAGANAALALGAARYRLLLNPDVRVPGGGLQALVTWMDRHPAVGIASPELVSLDGARVAAGRAFPSVTSSLLEFSRAHRLLPSALRGRILQGPYRRPADWTNAGWVPGTAMVIRAAALAEVGGFDERFFLYGEDIELCWRIRQTGWLVGVCAATAFQHDGSASAVRSFGWRETQERVAAGIHAATIRIRGHRTARLIALLTGATLVLEARDRKHTQEQRQDLLWAAGVWFDLAASGQDNALSRRVAGC